MADTVAITVGEPLTVTSPDFGALEVYDQQYVYAELWPEYEAKLIAKIARAVADVLREDAHR